jgi:hypothetical protein
MPAEHRFDPREELLDLLLEKVDQDPYPSTTMMDMIEEMLTRDRMEAYARILMAKVSADNFPSLDLIARVKALG